MEVRSLDKSHQTKFKDEDVAIFWDHCSAYHRWASFQHVGTRAFPWIHIIRKMNIHIFQKLSERVMDPTKTQITALVDVILTMYFKQRIYMFSEPYSNA